MCFSSRLTPDISGFILMTSDKGSINNMNSKGDRGTMLAVCSPAHREAISQQAGSVRVAVGSQQKVLIILMGF